MRKGILFGVLVIEALCAVLFLYVRPVPLDPYPSPHWQFCDLIDVKSFADANTNSPQRRIVETSLKSGKKVAEIWYDDNLAVESVEQWTEAGDLIDSCRVENGFGDCRFRHNDGVYGNARMIRMPGITFTIFYDKAQQPYEVGVVLFGNVHAWLNKTEAKKLAAG